MSEQESLEELERQAKDEQPADDIELADGGEGATESRRRGIARGEMPVDDALLVQIVEGALLAAGKPLTVADLYTEMGRATGRTLIRVPLTRAIAKIAIDRLPGVHALMRIPSSAVDYLTHPTHYLTGNQVDLEGSGISCPTVGSYMPNLVRFFKAHPEISSAAMI